MADDTSLLTVGELIRRLQAVDPDALVVIECEDSYYSGPAQPQTETRNAGRFGPFKYMTPGEDAYGRPIPRTERTSPGGWRLLDDPVEEDERILERRPAFVLFTDP